MEERDTHAEPRLCFFLLLIDWLVGVRPHHRSSVRARIRQLPAPAGQACGSTAVTTPASAATKAAHAEGDGGGGCDGKWLFQ